MAKAASSPSKQAGERLADPRVSSCGGFAAAGGRTASFFGTPRAGRDSAKANTVARLPPSLATAALICSAGWTVRSSSQIAKSVFRPALAHPSLVLGGRPHRRRKALATPFRPTRVLPRARRIDEHAIPQSGAELR